MCTFQLVVVANIQMQNIAYTVLDILTEVKFQFAETVINLRNYPSLAGLSYGEVRRGFPEV